MQIQVDFSESGLVFYAANLGNCAEFTVTWRRLKNMPISLFEAIVEVLTAKVLEAS